MPNVRDELQSAADSIRSSVYHFRLGKRHGQHWRVYLGTEKRGQMGLLEKWFGNYPVQRIPFGGQTSTTVILNVRREVAAAKAAGQECVALYCGDYDPSGLAIPKSFAELSGCAVIRVGLNKDQVDEFKLPRGEAKKDASGKYTDMNCAAMLRETGEICQVEMDALPPDVLKGLYMDAFNKYWDADADNAARAEEREERNRLAEIVEPMALRIEELIEIMEFDED